MNVQLPSELQDLLSWHAGCFASPLADRLGYLSKAFLGRRYVFGALGEGAGGEFDRFPRVQAEAFDCLTYVNTVLA